LIKTNLRQNNIFDKKFSELYSKKKHTFIYLFTHFTPRMKRKLVKHGKSTLIVSLPSKWIKKNNLKKGDEIDINEKNSGIEITSSKIKKTEEIEANISNMGPMVPRYIHALYKKGIDVLKLKYKDPEYYFLIKNSLGKETIGYEIVEHNLNSCIIKNVMPEFKDFDITLKKTILLLYTQSTQLLNALSEKDKEKISNTLDQEIINNTFTTLCRRQLNKAEHNQYKKTGPFYYMVEDIENIADELKYIANYFLNQEKIKINKEILLLFEDVNKYIRDFYEFFYRFDKKYLKTMGEDRKKILTKAVSLLENNNGQNSVLIHHLMVVTQKTFCLIGPHLINIF
jgi:phosphate uptake regulator